MDYLFEAILSERVPEFFAGYGWHASPKQNPNDLPELAKFLRLTRIFLVDNEYPEDGAMVDMSIQPLAGINLPFSACYFENARLSHHLFSMASPEEATSGKYGAHIWAILAIEQGNKHILTVFDVNASRMEWDIWRFTAGESLDSAPLEAAIEEVINSVHDKRYKVGEVKTNTSYKSRSGLPPHKVRKIIIIAAKNTNSRLYGSRPVDWKHSWEVMGHWRRVPGIGKNREGQYCMSEKTWVQPYAKGDGPFIPKTRIVKEST